MSTDESGACFPSSVFSRAALAGTELWLAPAGVERARKTAINMIDTDAQ